MSKHLILQVRRGGGDVGNLGSDAPVARQYRLDCFHRHVAQPRLNEREPAFPANNDSFESIRNTVVPTLLLMVWNTWIATAATVRKPARHS